MGPLAAATREIASLGDHDAILAAVARLARVVCGASGAEVVRAREKGAVEALAVNGAPISSRGAALAARIHGSLSGTPEQPDEGSLAVLPLGSSGHGLALALVVERSTPFRERDLEELSVFASFAALSLVHATSRAALREADARDAATLGAIGDASRHRPDRYRAYAQQAAASSMGVTREEAIGRRLRELPGLSRSRPPWPEPERRRVVPLPRGEMVVHRHGYEGESSRSFTIATEHTI
jgi:hypothetical protein